MELPNIEKEAEDNLSVPRDEDVSGWILSRGHLVTRTLRLRRCLFVLAVPFPPWKYLLLAARRTRRGYFAIVGTTRTGDVATVKKPPVCFL